MLERLSHNNDPTNRQAAAGNPRCASVVLKRLARDERWFLRKAVATNPNCDKTVLERLAQDTDRHVSEPAQERLRCW